VTVTGYAVRCITKNGYESRRDICLRPEQFVGRVRWIGHVQYHRHWRAVVSRAHTATGFGARAMLARIPQMNPELGADSSDFLGFPEGPFVLVAGRLQSEP
jgi:hypothetical protein